MKAQARVSVCPGLSFFAAHTRIGFYSIQSRHFFTCQIVDARYVSPVNGWIEFRPQHIRLQGIIERYLLRRLTPLRKSYSARILPRSGPSLFIDLGRTSDVDRFQLNGLHETFYCMPVEAGVQIDQIIVEFTPGALRSFSSVPMPLLRSQLLPVYELFGTPQEWSSLATALIPHLPERRVLFLEEFLMAKLKEGQRTERLIYDIVHEMKQTNALHARAELERRSSYGIRTLERQFLDMTGMNRRSLLAVFRFERARDQLALLEKESAGQSLTGIALDAGYYDQAQFNRDMKRRTGLPPGRLRGEIPACDDC
ncbi:Helix-turn-helix, AraC domain-containing protein [Leptonema illini DSM 21528]|uniref:Helix-turn-helix, AraC domain-containing protein n=1 Tax=Leptonema illini DSM 21528 TaxID=929563 RepID=H2CAC8_9LEPT|nr:Helix-turn-helix, AraC domain-containing protein [Leptonema illini DSM 21528]